MVTSFVCGFCSAPDHLSDGCVFGGEVVLPVSQIFLGLVVSEVDIVLSHEEQHFSVVSIVVIYLAQIHWFSGVLTSWLGSAFPLNESLRGCHIALLGQSRHAECGSPFPDPDRLDQRSVTFDHCSSHGLIVRGLLVVQDQL